MQFKVRLVNALMKLLRGVAEMPIDTVELSRSWSAKSRSHQSLSKVSTHME